MTDNLDYQHKRMMAAIKGLADGRKLADHVVINDYGREVRIADSLRDGAELFKEKFHEEHRELVQQAFSQFGAVPPSHFRKDECCCELLRLGR